MPPTRPSGRIGRPARRARAGLFVAGIVLSALAASTALTQHSPGLRGPLTENEILRQLRPAAMEQRPATIDDITTATTAPAPSPAPRRQSPSLFTEDDDTLFADPVESQVRTTSGARERRRERQRALSGEWQRTVDVERAGEEESTTAALRAQPLNDVSIEELRRAAPENIRQEATEGRSRGADPNPYAPVGLRAGRFDLFPSIEQGIGRTSNAGNVANGESSTFSETTLRLDAQSDWSRHTARLSGSGTYRKSIAGAHLSEFEGNLDGEFRLDLGHDFQARAGLAYDVRPESAHAPGAITNVASRPNRHMLTGSAGLAKDMGPTHLAATARLTRTLYDDARLTDGSKVSQRERNSTLATMTLRGGYAISPAIRPFVETEIGRRFQDVRVDADGFERSANRYALRGGVEFDLNEKLSGEVAAGWLTERPDDSALGAISGLSVEGNLNWSPVRGTNVTLFGTTSVEGSTTPGESGTLFYSGSLTFSRELRANLTGSTTFGADYRRYPGSGEHDLNLRGEASLTWWLNRYAGVVGRLRHERFRSSFPGRDSRETSVYLGIRAQR